MKNIVEAINKLRPGDRIDKVISNKFAIVSPLCTNGNFADKTIMGLDNGKVFSYCLLSNVVCICKLKQSIPSIDKIGWWVKCKDGKERYIIKTTSYRKHKKQYRRLLRECINANIIKP